MDYQQSFIDLDIDWFHSSGLFDAGLNKQDCLLNLRGQNSSVAIISDGIYSEHEGLCGLNIIRKLIGTVIEPTLSGLTPTNLLHPNVIGKISGESLSPAGDEVRGTAMAGILAGRSVESRTRPLNYGCYPLSYVFPSGVGVSDGTFCPLILSGLGFSGKIAEGFNLSYLDGEWEKDVSQELPVWLKLSGENPEAFVLSWDSSELMWQVMVNTGPEPEPLGINFSGGPAFLGPDCTGCPLGLVSFFDESSDSFAEASFSAVFDPPPLADCEEVVPPSGTIEGLASQISVLYDYPYLYKGYWDSLVGNHDSKMQQALVRLLDILNDIQLTSVDVLILDLIPSRYPITPASMSAEIREQIKNKIIEISEDGTTIILVGTEYLHNVQNEKSYDVNLVSSGNYLLDTLIPEIRPNIIPIAHIGPPFSKNSVDIQTDRWPPYYSSSSLSENYPDFSLSDFPYYFPFKLAPRSWGEHRMIHNGLCFPCEPFNTYAPGVPISGGRPISLPPEEDVDYESGPIPGPLNSLTSWLRSIYGRDGPYNGLAYDLDFGNNYTYQASHVSAAIAGGVAAIIHGFKRKNNVDKLNVIQVLKGCVYSPIDYTDSQTHSSYFPSHIYQYTISIINGLYPNGLNIGGIEKEIYIKGWYEKYGYGTTNFKLLGRALSSFYVGHNPIGDDVEEPNASVQLVPCQREWFAKHFTEDKYNPTLDLSDKRIIGSDNTKSGWPDIGWPPFSTPRKDENFNENVNSLAAEPQPSVFVPDSGSCSDDFMGWPMASCFESDLMGYLCSGSRLGNCFISLWENSITHDFDPVDFNEKPYWVPQTAPSASLYSGEYLYWDDGISKWVISMTLGGQPIEIGTNQNPRQAIMDLSPLLCPMGFWNGTTDPASFTRPDNILFAYPENVYEHLPT